MTMRSLIERPMPRLIALLQAAEIEEVWWDDGSMRMIFRPGGRPRGVRFYVKIYAQNNKITWDLLQL